MDKMQDRMRKLKEAAVLRIEELKGGAEFDDEEESSDGAAAPAPTANETKAPRSDSAVLSSVPVEFFEENCDATEFVLQSMPAHLDEAWLLEEMDRHEVALDVVNSQLSERIVKSYSAFVQGMAQIHELGTDLQMTGVICRNGRRELAKAQSELITGPLFVLQQSSKMKKIEEVIRILEELDSLQQERAALDSALASNDFPTAIDLGLTLRQRAQDYQKFNCMHHLDNDIQSSYEGISDQMSSVLLEMCLNFKADVYKNMLLGFKKLGKPNRVNESITPNFTSIVQQISKRILLDFIAIQTPSKKKLKAYKKNSFKELCHLIPEESFTSCLRQMFHEYCDLLYNHRLMQSWHLQHEKHNQDENLAFYGEVAKEIERSRRPLWEDMQKYTATFLKYGANLATFKVEPFIMVLSLSKKMIRIGDEFCGGFSTSLRDALKARSKAYFTNFHRTRMEYLRTMLENDMWQVCPVSSNFSALDLKEFNFLRTSARRDTSSPTTNKESFFASYSLHGNPFVFAASENANDSVDTQEEVVNANPSKQATNGPLLTSTTIKVIRMVGNHLQMMDVLDSIAGEVLRGIIAIVEFYLFNVYCFFSNQQMEKDDLPLPDLVMSPRLRSLLARLGDTYLPCVPGGAKPPTKGTGEGQEWRIHVASINRSLDSEMSNPNCLFGLSERIVGMESLLFVASVLRSLHSRLQDLVPPQLSQELGSFYSGTLDAVLELRNFVYNASARRMLPHDAHVASIEKTKFDIKQIGMEHSSYVDVILVDFQKFDLALKAINENSVAITVTPEIAQLIWESVIRNSMHTLVEGYSRAKKCSNEGRALMSLDVKMILSGLEKLCSVRPIPGWQMVENYIKAYYMSEEEVASWVTNREFTTDQIIRLINVGPGVRMSRRAKNKLIDSVNSSEKKKRVVV